MLGELFGEEVPSIPPELEHVFEGFRDLGRDANGSALYSERRAWLDESGISDPGEREAFHRIWNELEAERRAAYREELDESRRRR